MSRNLRRYQTALFGFDAVARRMAAADWDEPSKCEGWSCREVAGHVIWHTRKLAATAGEGDRPVEAPEAEVAGDDPVASWIATRDRVLLALDRPDVLATVAKGPFGSSAIDGMLPIAAADIHVHSWDIGSAVGIDAALDPGVAEDSLSYLASFGDGLRGHGVMGPEIQVPDDAPVVDRLLGLCGRDPA